MKRRTMLGGIGALGLHAVSGGTAQAAGHGTVPAAAARPRPVRPLNTGFVVGVAGAHYISQNRGYDPESLSALVQSGATGIRANINWSSVEKEKGVYEFDTDRGKKVREAVAAGLDVMVLLTGNNPLYDDGGRPTSEEAVAAYTQYVLTVVRNLRDVVTRFEIWNEWETGGRPEDYLRVLRSAGAAVRAEAPEVEILGGSMLRQKAGESAWIDALLDGGVLGLCDALSLHTYNQGESAEQRTPEGWLETRMEFMAGRVRAANGGEDFPMYVTEMGWPQHTKPTSTDYEETAAFLARLYLLGATLPYCKGVYWYNLQDNGWKHEDPEFNFGLIRPDGTPKPAYFAFRSVAALLTGGSRFVERLPSEDPDIWALRFAGGSGSTIALWSAHLDDDWSVVLRDEAGQGKGKLRVEEAGRPAVTKDWGREQWYDSTQVDPDEPVLLDEAEFTVRDAPLLISGDNLEAATLVRVLKRTFPLNV